MRRLLTAAACGVALVAASGALADGDPASDFLVQQDVFVPYPPPSPAATRSLAAAVAAVTAKGDRVKVAVIATPQDLGSVPSLFGKPQDYATFLAAELAFAYKGPLLVVMPAGAGFVGGSAALASAAVSGSGPTALTQSAAALVPRLERAGALHYRDTHRPSTFVAAATGRAGRTLSLRYQAWDDSGRARVRVTVTTSAGRALASLPVAMRDVRQGAWYAVRWHAPATLGRATLAVCAVATDPAGNRSRPSCGKLALA
jgi:hypothetical protein